MAEEVILTREGLEELEKRLEYLKVEKRAEITALRARRNLVSNSGVMAFTCVSERSAAP